MNQNPPTPPTPPTSEDYMGSPASPPSSTAGPQTQQQSKPPSWIFKTLFIFAILGTSLAVILGTAVYWHFSRGLPKIITVADYRPLAVTRILGGGGKEDEVIGEYYKERRYLVPYEKIPDLVVHAFISAEDDKFFEHPGINIASMIRAGLANFRAGHVVQGGSTITQQVAKSLLLTPERSFVRKIKEVILASRIEHNLTKKQILYLYLNQIYLGRGAYGIQAASHVYFNKDVADITLAEAALLAGMPQAPGKYSPLLNPKKAKERQLYVLRRMYENKYIADNQMSDAAAQPLKVFQDEDLNSKYSAYLDEYIRKYLVEKYGEKAVYEEGLTVNVPTTRALSLAATESIKSGLEKVDKRVGFRGPIQHLNDDAEIEKFLNESRLKLIEKKLHYQVLFADGRLDPIEEMHNAGIFSDNLLLDAGQTYQAVVSHVDDRKKSVTVTIGAAKGEMQFDTMKWAHALRDETNKHPPEPKSPSQVVKKGDIVLVRVKTATEKEVQVGLDQEPQVQGALFSMEAQTGYVLAMVGGYDFEESEFNRATQAMRQPGSSFKPIIYAAALEKGYTPASVIIDSPIVYEDSTSGKWKPSNYEEKFYGDTTFRQALIKSRNVPTIKIVQSIQVPKMIEYAKRIGLNAQYNADLSISLGSAAVTLMDLTRVYSLFPRLGRRVTPIFINEVVDRDGKILEEQKPQPLPNVIKLPAVPTPSPTTGEQVAQVTPQAEISAVPVASPSPVTNGVGVNITNIIPQVYPLADDPDQVLDPRVAYVMTHLMKEVVNYGTGHEAKNLGRAAAGKTGTTNDFIDAWFMGFTPQVVTGVWVGFDNQRAIGPNETGARAALPIWLSYMKEAVKGYPGADVDFNIPPGVVFASIDPTSGKLAPPNSSQSIKEAFIEGTQPTETSDGGSAAPESQSQFFKEDIE